MRQQLKILAEGGSLTREEAEDAMHLLMRGEAEPEETAALLMGLRARGETSDELTGFTAVMRAYAVQVALDDPHAIDLCGTGGDATGTFNISTAAAFVCAGAGVTVAKHGNRSVSSQCGSADVLEALGARVDLKKEGVEFCLKEAGMAFLFAPFFHPSMRHVMPVRRKLGVRTFFNILGPLANPAGVRRQLVGAFHPGVARQMADILGRLGAEHVMVVHAGDGLDEISLSAPTTAFVAGRDAGAPGEMRIEPRQCGIDEGPLDGLRGGTATDNAEIIRRVLAGTPGPALDVVLLNASFALLVSGRFSLLEEACKAARESIGSGAALRSLHRFIEVSREAPDA